MFKSGLSLRSRLVAMLVATSVFVVPVVAQDVEVTIEFNGCWLFCSELASSLHNDYGWSEEEAQKAWANCMNALCGGI